MDFSEIIDQITTAKRITRIRDCILIEGDSIAVMGELIEKGFAADMLFCDAPYKLTSGGKSGLMRGIFDPEDYSNDGSIVECNLDWPDFMGLFYKILKSPSHAYVMANNRHIANCENAALEAEFHLHNWLVWDKITATPNRQYMKNCEFIGFFKKGKAFSISNCSSKQLISCPQVDQSHLFDPTKKGHPTEKPIALMEHYIVNSSKPGQIVIDPFAGSFSTGVSCVRQDRAFIGIEIDPSYFDIGVQRITNAYDNYQKSLF